MTYTYFLTRPMRSAIAAALATLISTTAYGQFSLPGGLGSTAPSSSSSTFVSPNSVTGGPSVNNTGNAGPGGTGNDGAGRTNTGPARAGGTAQDQGASGNRLDENQNTLKSSTEERSQQDNDQDAGGSRQANRGQQQPSRPRQTSQFQQFVEQSTGKLLPVYGQELFELPQAAYAPNNDAPARDDYVLGPGDEVQIQVWGSVDYNGSVPIDRNGQVNIPRVGVINLAGTRVRDVERVLRENIGRNFTNFYLNANLGKLRSIQVYVVGQAQQPGTYNLSSLGTLVNALFASGGPNANGSMRNIELKRNGKVITTFDLYDFIGKGDQGRDVTLLGGDVIVIPPVGPRVAVTGALDTAAIYELKSGQETQTTLNDILALSGGVPALATVKKALIERVTPDQNPPRRVQDLSLDAQGLQLPLRDGDVITLLGISPAFGNAVTLQGNVAAPLRYRWFEGMRIRDLIPERDALVTADYYRRKNLLVQNSGVASTEDATKAGNSIDNRVRGMVDEINWDYAVIERLDRDRLRTQLIPFNLGRAVLQGDESQNLALEPGDVVTVLSQKDLRLPIERRTRLVRLEGEVAAPGIYEALPGETMRQIVQRLGGLTPQAYIFGTEIDRESVRQKQQQNLDLLIRRLEQQQQSQILFILANRNAADAAAQAAVVAQQQALARNQLETLRKLRSNGRIALELNPDEQSLGSLPELPLEDGDRVMVPPVPGFVTAIGAVNNENVFIYKTGKTVSEVIKSAGLREEADTDQMFVVRADGSIVTRRERSSFFGSGLDGMALMPGDSVVVPEKLDRETKLNFFTRQFKDWTQVLAQLGLSAAALTVLRNNN